MSIFSGRHYPKDVILWAVRWYCRYGVSYRDLEQMLTERDVPVDHTTIYRWVQRYAPELDKRTRWYRRVGQWGSAIVAGRCTTAQRILPRLRLAMGPLALRVDHIGSTSVPALPAKDLIDLQVVVTTLPDTATAAAHAIDAGLVAVRDGNFYAIDRHDHQHPVRILVDADPGRPVNVHIHPATSPVWREMLLFRDWLRGDPAHRQEYLRFKRDLAARSNRDVNDYSRDKRSWVNHAEHWAHTTGWEIEPHRPYCPGG